MIYVYAKPNQMEGHMFTDDVAIVEADDKEAAVEKLRQLYSLSEEDVKTYVRKVWFNDYGVAILTDY